MLLPDCQLQQWAAVKLIFFTLDSVRLGFGFVLKTMLVTEECFCYCSNVLTLAFSASHTTLTVSGLGVHKELGCNTSGTAGDTGKRPKGYSMIYAIMFSI